MTSFMALDGVTSFLRLKDVTITCNVCDVVLVLAGVLQCKKKLNASNVFSSFIVC